MIINKDIMRGYNERSVLAEIINNGPLSRNEISQKVGLNKVTVSDIVGQLLERQFVKSLGEGHANTGSSGRKPELVEYNAEFGYTVNFSISGSQIEMLATKFDGRVLEYNVEQINHQPISIILKKMDDLIAQLPDFHLVNGLQAISIAVFGVVYENEILHSVFIDYDDVDLVGYFRDKYGVPVIIENEANLSAIFEEDYSKQELQNLISISIHEGIGAGVIIDAHLYAGNYGQAGEIGRMLIPDSGKSQVRLTKLPTFESEWSLNAIVAKACVIKQNKDYNLAMLIEDYKNHDDQIAKLIDSFCYYLAIVTSHLISAYDPQMIFYNSPLIDSLPEILKNVQMKLTFLPLVPPLVMSKDVHYATLLGGASMAIHSVLHMNGTRLILHH